MGRLSASHQAASLSCLVQFTLSQMLPFCMNSWRDLSLPRHNISWLQPQRISPLEQIRLWTITTLLRPLTPISSGSAAVSQECRHFSTPFTPNVTASSPGAHCFMHSLSLSHSRQWALLTSVYESLEITNPFLILISMSTDIGLGRRVF